MKAVVCYGNGDIRYEEVCEAEPGPGEVSVRVRACGICGSDIQRALGTAAHYYPIVLGHEFSGVVRSVGEGVSSVCPGDHVAGIPLIPCFECRDCKNGNYALCRNYSFVGSRRQGAFADCIVLPERNVFKTDDSLSYEQTALFEPSTVALHALITSGYRPGTSVAVIGGGTIGVFVLQWAKILGASRVVVTGRSRKHLELSSGLGADAVISTPDGECSERLLCESDRSGFDFVYECAGSASTIKQAVSAACGKGRVCFIGTPSDPLSFSAGEWEQINRRELTLSGSWMSYSKPFPGKEWEMTHRHFLDGSLKYDSRMFYRILPMSRAADAFGLYMDGGKVHGRILLVNEQHL